MLVTEWLPYDTSNATLCSGRLPIQPAARSYASCAGLVVTRRDGAARVCDLNAKPLRAIGDWLRDYETLWGESMRNLKNYVEENR